MVTFLLVNCVMVSCLMSLCEGGERAQTNDVAVQVLTNLGEKLDESEVDELLKDVEVGKDGRINYVGKLIHIVYVTFNSFSHPVDFVTIVLSN